MHSKNIALFWDGGVESTMALQKLQMDKSLKVKVLFSIISKISNEIPFTGVPEVLVKMQAQQLKIPLIRIYLEDYKDYRFSFENIEKYMKIFKKSGITSIALPFLNQIDNSTDADVIYPNLDCDPRSLITEFISDGNKAVITGVNEEHTPLKFLGKDLSIETLNSITKLDIKTFTIYTLSFKSRLIFSKNITVNQSPYTVYKLREV